MTSVNQYIELYKSQREALCGHSAGALNAEREEALRALEGRRMPKKGDEDYEVTDLEDVFAPDYGVNVNRIGCDSPIGDGFRCDVPNLSTCLFFLLGDAFQAGKGSVDALPAGVIIKSLATAAVENADIVDRYYGKIAGVGDCPTALNTLLAQDGLFVYVPKGVMVEKPVQIVNILNAAVPMLVCRRMLIVVEDGGAIRLLSCDHTEGAAASLNSQVVEIFAGRRATVDFYDMEDTASVNRRVSSLYLRQEEESNVMIDGITLKNGYTRNNFIVDLAGDRTELHLAGMAMATGTSHIDNHTCVVHGNKCGHTDELFKYVLDEKAVGAFSGLVKVLPGADKTEAYQSNRNVLASTDARMYSKPQLLIDCDDVRCNHGSSIGQIDQTALFYMRSRGIPEREARLMLMQAFMNDVIDGVRLESLKDRLRHLVGSHILGNSSSCHECTGGCRTQNQK